MKLTLYTDTRKSLGTLSGIEADDLIEPRRREILMDELVSLLNRSEFAPHTDACTGETQRLDVPPVDLSGLTHYQPAPPLTTRLWNCLIWRAR